MLVVTTSTLGDNAERQQRHLPVAMPAQQYKFPECCLVIHNDLTQYIHHIWTSDQGLPQNSAYSLCQTPDGYLWIGTTEGLVRYDGVRFVVFDMGNTPVFRHNWVTALTLDANGVLWVGTRGGLARYEKGVFTGFTTAEGLQSDHVRALCYDKKNDQLFVGMFGGGVQILKNGLFTALPDYSPEFGLFVNTLALDAKGGLWIGTQGAGLNYVLPGHRTRYTTSNGLLHNTIYSLLSAPDGTLWVGTASGLQSFEVGLWVPHSPTSNGKAIGIMALFQDCDGSLWVGTEGDGVYRKSNKGWTKFREKDGLSGNIIISLLQDQNGAIWIGTQGSGINRLQNSAFTSYTTKNGLSNNIARPIFQSSDKTIWVGTVRGLNRLKSDSFEPLSGFNGVTPPVILSLAEEKSLSPQKPVLWVGTRGSGLYRFSKDTKQHITTKNGLSNDVVTSLFVEQKTGKPDVVLWAGTANGLNRIEKGIIQTFGVKEGLQNTVISCLLAEYAPEKSSFTVWIGTQGGLYRFHNGRFTAHTTQNGLAHNHVISLYRDSTGFLWIGSYGGGITLLRDGVFTTVNVRQGLYDNTAMCILEDEDGYFWVSCNKGIYRVKRKDLLDLADGKRKAVTCRAFGRSDGMKSVECNGGNQPAGWKTLDGALWFPTIAGVVKIDPRRLYTDPFVPTVIVEKVLSDTLVQNLTGPITIAAEHVKIEFRYTATSLKSAERVQFRYMLEGFDKQWVEAGARRTAYYTNLIRGREYRFRVMACNADGVWNPVAASVVFYLTPYYWETWWFYGICSCFLVVMVVALVRWWVLRLQHRAEELERIVDERTYKILEQNLEIQHTNTLLQEKNTELDSANRFKSQMLSMASHDLKNPLTTIMGLAQLLERQSAEDSIVKEFSNDIITVCKQMYHLVLDLLDTASKDLEKVELHYSTFDCSELVQEVYDRVLAQVIQKKQQLLVDTCSECIIIADKRRFYQVIENLVTNAIKYSPIGKTITITTKIERGVLQLSVQDEGPGISEEDQKKMFGFFQRLSAKPTGGESSTGVGLAIVKHLVELHGGTIRVQSSPGNGSLFIVEMPISRIQQQTTMVNEQGELV